MTELRLTIERDTQEDVEQALDDLDNQHAYDYLGEDIREILKGVDLSDEMEVIDAWNDYLEDNLKFPFDAFIAEPQDRGPLKGGQTVRVKAIFDVDDLYGILGAITHQRKTFHFPLCDLEAKDKKSSNYQVLKNYVVWFANR
ncbi:MAG: calcium-binding protein [Cyanobacteria bacterium P01_F01_bin.150]